MRSTLIAPVLMACSCAPVLNLDDEKNLLAFATCVGRIEGLSDVRFEADNRVVSDAKQAAEPFDLSVSPFLHPAANQMGELMNAILPDLPSQVTSRMSELRASTRAMTISGATVQTSAPNAPEKDFDAVDRLLMDCREPFLAVSKIERLEKHFAQD